jgi:hypothetical protein
MTASKKEFVQSPLIFSKSAWSHFISVCQKEDAAKFIAAKVKEGNNISFHFINHSSSLLNSLFCGSGLLQSKPLCSHDTGYQRPFYGW